ncbi:GNAT family N-acetyltransferase [Adhaeribacter aquaticus]|uniref:GNAT family N-acetyltransferase n=1 Tax=Adhaeribacter aquaticus TaxID=299567 RepID=UPI0004050093|nr:GNAT family N-acetyltransferase [Adhaeribacter aquaticus]
MVKIKRTNSDDKDFQTLIYELDDDLQGRYNGGNYHYDININIDHLDTVVVAEINEVSIGCGCFKEIDKDTVEIKRMYVNPHYRYYGVASTVVDELEKWAKERNYKQAVLETGEQQPEAIKFFEKHGFRIIENFEPYVGLEGSICMGKHL